MLYYEQEQYQMDKAKIYRLETEISRLKAERVALKKLEYYAAHRYWCEIDNTEFCTCGFNEVIRELSKLRRY